MNPLMATSPTEPAHTPSAPPTGIVRLYVANISPVATEEELASAIARIAPYERLSLIRNMHHGLCARFAFLDVAPEHEAAIRTGLEGAQFLGRAISVLSILGRPDRPGPDGV